jgi:hypothetical protein
LLGTPTAPTASTGTSTTQLATTAFVTTALSVMYPVGSIYINASVATNPATLLGFGTWTAFGSGKVLVGFNSADASFDTLEETGGSKDAITVAHTHTATSIVTDPGHNHTVTAPTSSGDQSFVASGITTLPTLLTTSTATTGITVATTNASTGSSGTNANLQPYITVNMWKRTA